MDTYPFVLEIASDVPEAAECVSTAASSVISRSPDVVRLLTVVAPAPSAFVTVAEFSVAAPVVDSVPATATSPLVSVIRSGSPLTPIFASVNRTDSTSTYDPPMDTYPFVLEIASDVPEAAECVSTAAVSVISRSPDVVRLLTVVAPAPSAFVTVAESSVAAPLVVRVVTEVAPAPSAFVTVAEFSVAAPLVDSVPATATSPLVSVIRSGSPLTPIFASVMRTDSTSTYDPVAPAMDTYPFVLEIASDVDPLCVIAAESADSASDLKRRCPNHVQRVRHRGRPGVVSFRVHCQESLGALSPIR